MSPLLLPDTGEDCLTSSWLHPWSTTLRNQVAACSMNVCKQQWEL